MYLLQDTVILLNFYSVHNDKSYWDNPEEFRPQRFLDENGQFRANNAAMPFGLGASKWYISYQVRIDIVCSLYTES